mgnify:CR=1 FL=1
MVVRHHVSHSGQDSDRIALEDSPPIWKAMPMTRKALVEATPVSVDEKAVRMILAELREAGSKGVLKSGLRQVLSRAAEEEDHARLPRTEEDRKKWAKALDKKVERCLRSLEADGAKIERVKAETGRLARFALKKGPTWDEHVSAEARLALKLAAMTLSHTGTRLWHEKLAVIEQFSERHMSHRDHLLFEHLDKVVKVFGGVEDPVVASLEEILEPILKGIEAYRMLAVDYQPAGAARSFTLEVVPYALTHDLFSGGAYLLVWDPRARLPKQLRLNRISSVKILKQMGIVSQPEKMQHALDYQIGAWACGDPPFEVVARIWGAAWVQSLLDAPPDLPGFESTIEKGRKSILVRFEANKEQGPVRWLLQFGCCAEVLEPKALRDRMREELRATLKVYNS